MRGKTEIIWFSATSPREVVCQGRKLCGERFEVGPFPPGATAATVRCPRGHKFHIDLTSR